jgi:putative transposase
VIVDVAAENFFATLKKELIHRRACPTRADLRTEVFDYIEVFYNRQRRHRSLGMVSAQFETIRQDHHLENSQAA